MPKKVGSNDKAQEIMSAARKILTEYGSSRTTVKEISAKAGVSRGLIHYYFQNMDEMFVEVFRDSEKEAHEIAKEIFKMSKTPEELASNLTAGFKHVMEINPGLHYLSFEGWVMSRKSDAIANEITSTSYAHRENYKKLLEDAAQRGAISQNMPFEELALYILAVLYGVGHILTLEPNQTQNNAIWRALERGLLCALEGFEGIESEGIS
jgi:AcrR family transcriptional regulator